MSESDSQNSPSERFRRLLKSAKAGDQTAIGTVLQEFRDYLLYVANKELDAGLRPKVGSSDIVQESMLTAHQRFEQFQGDTKQQLMAWLRQMLVNDLHHARRAYKGTQKRQVKREMPLQMNSSMEIPLMDAQMTPQTNAIAIEESTRLENAMSDLPLDYQNAIKLRNWEQKGFEEIGQIMDRSPEAARKLWTRAVLKLQEVLNKSA